MPASDVYGLMIKDDLTGLSEYSPAFRLWIPNSTFGKPTSASTSSTAPFTALSTASSAASATSPPESTGSIDDEEPSSATRMNGANIDTIIGVAGAGVGAIIVTIVAFSVWRLIKSEKKLAASQKRFRDRRHGPDDDDAHSPVTPQHAAHRRLMSSSSFGDGARASDLFERSPVASPNPLTPIGDSSTPTPFAAPPMVFPPAAASLQRKSKGPADLHRRPSQQLQEPPAGPAPEITGFAPTSPSEHSTLGAASGSHNLSQHVPKYTAFNPNTPPTRPASAAETETDSTIWGNHPT